MATWNPWPGGKRRYLSKRSFMTWKQGRGLGIGRFRPRGLPPSRNSRPGLHPVPALAPLRRGHHAGVDDPVAVADRLADEGLIPQRLDDQLALLVHLAGHFSLMSWSRPFTLVNDG